MTNRFVFVFAIDVLNVNAGCSFFLYRLVRRRVASVSDIDGELKESVATTSALGSSATTTAAMRAELFASASSPAKHQHNTWPPPEKVVIDLDEYTAMAQELADIKSQLVTLQTLLVSHKTSTFDTHKKKREKKMISFNKWIVY